MIGQDGSLCGVVVVIPDNGAQRAECYPISDPADQLSHLSWQGKDFL